MHKENIHLSECRLVVICTKEREDRSRLTTALDKHRVTTPIVSTVECVQSYLKKHFHVECQPRCPHNAPEVDPEQYVRNIKRFQLMFRLECLIIFGLG